jgi:broad specificity phosphatase PhoE
VGAWLFVRHGQSVANEEGWLSGHIDVPLSGHGRDQARAVAEQISGRPIARCFTSDLLRAVETADLALGALSPPRVATPALRERHMGVLEGQQKALHKGTPAWEALLSWGGAPEGGETLEVTARRMLRFLSQQEAIEGTTLVVGHGSALKTLIGLIDGEPVEVLGRKVLGNCEVVERYVGPRRWAELRSRVG